MPKRDATYMMGQRELIARAALEALLERGIFETSLRDICNRARVSIGAFYNHFPTKADAIVAARHLDLTEHVLIPPAQDWASYVRSMAAGFCSRGKRDLERRRLSLQFAAEILLMDANPEGLRAIYELQSRQMTANLQAVFDRGEVSLPLGLARTVEIHAQIGLGASYRLSNDLDLSSEEAVEIMEQALAATAGRLPL